MRSMVEGLYSRRTTPPHFVRSRSPSPAAATGRMKVTPAYPSTSSIRHEPHPEHPGWWTWEVEGPARYNSTLGKFLVRKEGPGCARCRIFPEELQTNLAGVVHGGAILNFIDISLFAGGSVAGAGVVRAVTLDCQVQFIAPGRPGLPLDAEVELLKETRRLAFLRGKVVQEGEVVAAFSGTLRKPS